ncbi:MAG: tetratricopeptide repeat protein [Candidatus Krumholzibacteria bacterium]|nr:tetratricopeptide repeat protein [Candidatus Krumholzibacteria bacterium]
MNKNQARRVWQAVSLLGCRRIVSAFVAAAVLVGISCDGKPVLEEASKEFEAGRYREVIYLVRHHLRRNGERSPELLFLAGRSWMRLGIEVEAEDAFAEVYSADSAWAPMIAEVLKEEALGSFESGLTTRGKRFMLQALNYDSSLDFGRYNAIAGERLLERRDFDGAIRYLSRYLEESCDSAGAAEVMMNLGAALEGKGETKKAIALYRHFKERYPKSRLKTTVRWKLENLLFEMAEELYRKDETEESELVLVDLASSAGSLLVRERANFLLAEFFEDKGDIEKAIHYYTEVVNLNLGSSGRLVERAKERIEKLNEISKLRH